ncbi:DUF4194 domain-containing protein [Nocardia sp. 2]|uniref:DUF4194 domain-containing protein n=1 Tax=Nocardia acididurans TaxID=2802282 RepID=A0ABS1MCR1_9NOCA|nr:DUF4194 domain-containing protein [Nocardia acididurans]MBL1078367.1 DUF4194 domain-containing protein [Nocardia acididurans]
MSDPTDPSFADVFGDDLSDQGSAASLADPVRLDPDAVFTGDDDNVGSRVNDDAPAERFDGDTSELPPELCWTLQELVTAPHITEKSRSWPVVLQYEQPLRSRLSELGLILEINREFRYAFTRQAEDPSPRSRTLLRAKTLSLAASALALYLYRLYVVSPDDPIVDRADMIEHLLAYRPSDDTDEVRFRDKINPAIRALDEAAIIKPIRGNNDRFTIYGVITAILTADQVAALEARYRAIAKGESADGVGGQEEGSE